MSKSLDNDDYEYGEKIDKCLTDLAIKAGTGVVVGGMFSLLFKRRRWPVTLGLGIGIGMAYTACENRFRSPYRDGTPNSSTDFKGTFKTTDIENASAT